MPYEVRIKPSALKILTKLEPQIRRRLIRRAEQLGEDPRPPDAETLKGEPGLMRVRVGDFRMIYTVQDDILLVLVLRVGHRRDIYR